MTENEIFNALQGGGSYALPYLIKLYHPDYGSLYYVNNNEAVEYDGNTYAASSFKYTPPKTSCGILQNGQLEITAIDNEVIDITDESDELFTVEVVGVIDQSGTITAYKWYKHQYGTVTVDESMKLTIAFSNDDRLGLTFPPYVFDSDNNGGNV